MELKLIRLTAVPEQIWVGQPNTPQEAAAYQEARDSYYGFKSPAVEVPGGRNLRSVWEFPTKPYKQAHFATFSPELPERCIKAATPEVGSCPKCQSPWIRVVDKSEAPHDGYTEGGKVDNSKRLAMMRQAARERGEEYSSKVKTLGWRASCKCGLPQSENVPSTVLDCFAGSGTTLWVAKTLGRRSVGYELSRSYCDLIIERNKQDALL